MYLQSSTLALTPTPTGGFTLGGDDAIYTNFTGSQRLRLLAVFKDRKSNEVVAMCADLRLPGGHVKIPRALFESDFALEQPPPASLAVEAAVDEVAMPHALLLA